MTLIIKVELFVTLAQLARGQTSVITVKISPAGEKLAPPVKIPVTVIIKSCNLILCVKLN